MNNLPATQQEWLDQIHDFEFVKVTFPGLYPQVVGFAEERAR
jgi:hypothetical protein